MKVRKRKKIDPVSKLFVDSIDPAACVRHENFLLHPVHLWRLLEVKQAIADQYGLEPVHPFYE